MSEHAEGFNRRRFLAKVAVAGGVVYTAPVVTSYGLSRASATPCFGLMAPPEGMTEDADAQVDARSDRTHSPCYKACLEQRANAEYGAHVQFFACVEAAGTNDGQINACANQYRGDLAKVVRDFRACSKPCS